MMAPEPDLNLKVTEMSPIDARVRMRALYNGRRSVTSDQVFVTVIDHMNTVVQAMDDVVARLGKLESDLVAARKEIGLIKARAARRKGV